MINATINTSTAKKSAKHVRKQGKIPGIMYGLNIPSTKIILDEPSLKKILSHDSGSGTIQLNVDGKVYNSVIKEIQKDPKTNSIIHIDFECFNGDKIVNVDIPINYLNETMVLKSGAILQKQKSTIKIRGKASKIPDKIDLVIKQQMLGHPIKVGDVEIGEELTILDNIESVIASINFSKNNNDATEETEEAAATESN